MCVCVCLPEDPHDRANIDGRMYIDPVEQYNRGIGIPLSKLKVSYIWSEINAAVAVAVAAGCRQSRGHLQ